MILIIDTAGETTFIGLWDKTWLDQKNWAAGRDLSNQILTEIEKLYKKSNKDFADTEAIIAAKGPGSFTGLRIGLSVANSLAYGLDIPVVGVAKINEPVELLKEGQKLLKNETKFSESVVPEYGREPNISVPKKLK